MSKKERFNLWHAGAEPDVLPTPAPDGAGIEGEARHLDQAARELVKLHAGDPPEAAAHEAQDAVTLGTGGNGEGICTVLAELPERTLLSEAALAKALGVTKRTVRRMAGRYELPPAVRFGGRSTWQAGAVLRWFERGAERAARAAERRAAAHHQKSP